jgi:hypothetical protein
MADYDIINKQLEEENKFESNINLKGIKDVTLSNGKRIIIMFKNNGEEPTIIDIDPKMNLVEEVKKRQEEYVKYQGTDSVYNTETILDDIAKESNAFIEPKVLGDDTADELFKKYQTDREKLKIVSSLLKKADKDNVLLPPYDRFAYIDPENNCIISMTGKVIEARFDSLNNEVIIKSPESASEYRDQEVDEDELGENERDKEETKDEDFSDKEIEELYEEEFYHYLKDISDEKKQEIMDNLRKALKDADYIATLPPSEQNFYYNMYNSYAKKKQMSYEKARVLKLVHKDDKEEEREAGISSYVYIALVVLVIVFAIFMFIIFRR